ncbi:MAG TPA: hypothetical protein VNZ61_01850 [Roseomonas sp.]|nr:hypothetical protein [Roseomonas sp.]
MLTLPAATQTTIDSAGLPVIAADINLSKKDCFARPSRATRMPWWC